MARGPARAKGMDTMQRPIFYLSLILGIALSLPGCGSSTTAKRRTTPKTTDAVVLPPPSGPVVVFPVQPGAGEQAVIAAAQDELGSFLVSAVSGGRYLVAQDRTTCKPGDPSVCKDLDLCAAEVRTRVCEFATTEAEPTACHDVVLKDGYAVEVAVHAPFVGVEMIAGVCVDAERKQSPIAPNTLWWRMPREGHPRGFIIDMAAGGGSPAPGGTTWYTVPVVPQP